ncbi:MAG: MotA/TolQ/ExbB proton channel family protein [Rickettsiales bacterium]|jgi:biopolymer transport protein TolQ|nr:MotA/TolQ/ExbB proton channel family protein [Rickettsiales bacterium]
MEKIPVKKFAESEIVDIASASTAKSFSIVDMFVQADLFVQIIMLILVLMSIYSWAIALEKIFLLKSITKEYNLFNKLLMENNYDIALIEQKHFSTIKKLNIFGEIIITIYNKICSIKNDAIGINKEELLRNIELKIYDVNNRIEDKLYILGTISSSAPFIGLLGTVWGIMHSFQSIVFLKNASISAVAPGIAEALLATALGLIVAIPALIFNNKFYSSIESLNIKFRNSFIKLISKI